MSSGWFDCTEPSLSTTLQGNKVCRVLCTCSGWFKHIEPPRAFSNHIITTIARCVEFCHMSSGSESVETLLEVISDIRQPPLSTTVCATTQPPTSSQSTTLLSEDSQITMANLSLLDIRSDPDTLSK